MQQERLQDYKAAGATTVLRGSASQHRLGVHSCIIHQALLPSKYISQGWCHHISIVSLHLQHQPPIWAPICVLAALLPIQLIANSLGKQQQIAQMLELLQSHGRPRKLSRLLASDRLSKSRCSHMGSEEADGSSLPLLLFVNLSFKQK